MKNICFLTENLLLFLDKCQCNNRILEVKKKLHTPSLGWNYKGLQSRVSQSMVCG